MYAVQQHLGVNAGLVKMICENIKRCKLGLSKKDCCWQKFGYIKKEDLPEDYKKSANIKPKRTVQCSTCGLKTKWCKKDCELLTKIEPKMVVE